MTFRLPDPLRAALFTFSIMLTGCAAGTKIPHQQAPHPRATNAKSTIYVLRPNAAPVFLPFPIRLDGKPVASLPNRTYTWLQVESGSHLLEFRDAYATAIPHLKHAQVFSAGQTYYFGYSHIHVGDEPMSIIPLGTTSVLNAGGPIFEAVIAEYSAAEAQTRMEELSYVAPTK